MAALSASLKRCPDTKREFFTERCRALLDWTAAGGYSLRGQTTARSDNYLVDSCQLFNLH
jgi:hypothetical protein